MSANHDVLLTTLQLAVPMWIEQLRAVGGQLPYDERDRIIEQINSKGDDLQFGGKRGSAAQAFNAMAKGLAALAYAPGGVTFCGIHWCTDHAICEQADAYAAATIKLDRGKVGRVATTAVL